MRNFATLLVVTAVLLTVAAPRAHAQKGVGDPTGVARQPVKPEIVSLSGTLVEVKTGPCEATTGRAINGTHLILKTDQKEKLNVHLGPAAVMADTVAKLSDGQQIAVKAFRTEKMKDNHYVALSLTFGETTVDLRDEGFRPAWAGGSAGLQQMTAGQAGLGMARDQGWGQGQRWRQGQGRGRGQAWGQGRGQTWGQGRGQGWGQGQGPGQGWGQEPGRGQQSLAPAQGEPAASKAPAGRLAITAVGPSLDAAVAPQFGRSPYFLLVNPEDGAFETVANTNTKGGNAAGQATELLVAKGVGILLTGKCGPNALESLAAAGIQVVPNCSGTVRAMAEQFKGGQLPSADKTRAPSESAPKK